MYIGPGSSTWSQISAPAIPSVQQGIDADGTLEGVSVIPTVILGGNDRIHFAFHPEKDGKSGDDRLSSLQKMEISIL
jgi:hypothetical protein